MDLEDSLCVVEARRRRLTWGVGIAIAAVMLCCVVAGYASYTTLASISSRDVCSSVNRQAVVLRGILVNSVKATKRREATYRKLGLPPYSVRLKNAQELAATITGCP